MKQEEREVEVVCVCVSQVFCFYSFLNSSIIKSFHAVLTTVFFIAMDSVVINFLLESVLILHLRSFLLLYKCKLLRCLVLIYMEFFFFFTVY